MIEYVRRSVSSRADFEATDWEMLCEDTGEWLDAINIVATDIREERALSNINRENELGRIRGLGQSRENGRLFNSTRDRFNAQEILLEGQLTRLKDHQNRAKQLSPGDRIKSLRGIVTLAMEGADPYVLEEHYIKHIDDFDTDDWADVCVEDDA